MVKRYSEREIKELANILKNDGVISVPTDTIYGLCASINSLKAYNKLIEIKHRPVNKSFPVMCLDIKQMKEIAVISKQTEEIINKFMPGPLTIIVKTNNIPEYVTNGKDTIALRMVTSKALEEIIDNLGSPIFMTSANQSDKEPCHNLDEIEKECPSIDAMLEGETKFGVASTIIDCTSNDIKVLREGPIKLEELR